MRSYLCFLQYCLQLQLFFAWRMLNLYLYNTENERIDMYAIFFCNFFCKNAYLTKKRCIFAELEQRS